MFQSLKLGRVMGIDLFVHPTFWLLPLLVLFGGAGSGVGGVALDLAVLFATFGCVALHELGHAAAAKLYGIRTRDIVLYPIGGVARLEGMPERPFQEIVVALAGPAVNVAIAAGITALMLLDGVLPNEALRSGVGFDALWAKVLAANVVLVLFNLIPAFPMDGGRVFRAAVSWFTDRVTATEIAVVVGGVFATLIGLYGLYETQYMLAVLAAFVFMTGRAELAAVRVREEAKDWRRQRARRARSVDPWEQEIPVARRATAEPAERWEFDPATRMWTLWRGDVSVRRVAAR